ncbi:MAG: hypothetical protein AOA65_2054 [Candidatus Bathyarchaeota archaeon BA1]|nr:MAG: hypothetical protein AOA65_2054 [Candidatus Bathyarchaeota archaeon BA1]
MGVMEPKEFWEDAKWGREHYAELQERYKDQWVAIVDKRVVSYGKNLKKVEEEAKKLTKKEHIYTTFVESGAAIY